MFAHFWSNVTNFQILVSWPWFTVNFTGHLSRLTTQLPSSKVGSPDVKFCCQFLLSRGLCLKWGNLTDKVKDLMNIRFNHHTRLFSQATEVGRRIPVTSCMSCKHAKCTTKKTTYSVHHQQCKRKRQNGANFCAVKFDRFSNTGNLTIGSQPISFIHIWALLVAA